ncbi:hypothetical protein [Rhodococcus erythropolis]
MNAYRTTDTTGSDMIVMGTSADNAREVAPKSSETSPPTTRP